VIFGRQKSYLGNSDRLLVSCTPGVTPRPDSGGATGYERRWPYQCPPVLFATNSSGPGGADARGTSVGDIKRVIDIGGTVAGGEQRCPYSGCTRSGGDGRL
jgi:hypothetical protein